MLNEKDSVIYWYDRARESGEVAVGFNAKDLEKQETQYEAKERFVMKYVNSDLTTLDYGCGIGRWAKYWAINRYMGVDVTRSLLNIAWDQNPNHYFFHIQRPYLEDYAVRLEGDTQQIFTSTVLQHCDDSLVKLIMESWMKWVPTVKTFAFYEINNGKTKTHVLGRPTFRYRQLLHASGFEVKSDSSSTHFVHGEAHTLSLIEVL